MKAAFTLENPDVQNGVGSNLVVVGGVAFSAVHCRPPLLHSHMILYCL